MGENSLYEATEEGVTRKWSMRQYQAMHEVPVVDQETMSDLHFVIGTKRNEAATDRLLEEFRQMNIGDGTLYIGYPVLSTDNEQDLVDALLTSSRYGIVVFDLLPSVPQNDTDAFWHEIEERQTRIFLAIKSKLFRHPTLTQRRELKVPIKILSYSPVSSQPPDSFDVTVFGNGELKNLISQFPIMEEKFYASLNAAIESVSTIKPSKKRTNVINPSSKGATIRQIEKEIANLDRWQKRGAIECPEGPQRIRGLAGSGKTIALALKAAYLHAQHPDWLIAITFYTRSLYQQYKDLIRRFSFEHTSDEPNWERVQLLHAWGSERKPGLYAEMSKVFGFNPRDYNSAKTLHKASGAFEGICNELEFLTRDKSFPKYDAVLIDEAQDLPHSFFKVAYRVTKSPKRIIYAYDELQSLSGNQMLPAEELFGRATDNSPLVTLNNALNNPHQDVILPVCYRNTPWALVSAHAVGFGIYRKDGLVQLFDDLSLWSAIGYENKSSNDLGPGKDISLARRRDSYPRFFETILSPEDSVKTFTFSTPEEQAKTVAQMIATNIKEDELDPEDILVIHPNPLTVANETKALRQELVDMEIPSHIAGVTTSQDEFFQQGSVAISGIYRAKGNEAPMVYIINSHWCFDAPELIKKRNIIFTAITRSRAWVRICGVGTLMDSLKSEIQKVEEHKYQLDFQIPTAEKLKSLRRIHRDMTREDRSMHEIVEQFSELVRNRQMDPQQIPPDVRQLLTRDLENKNTDDDIQ